MDMIPRFFLCFFLSLSSALLSWCGWYLNKNRALYICAYDTLHVIIL